MESEGPTARPEEATDSRIEVLLLGTYHMDNPGLDTINIEADDVLVPSRQRELSNLVDRLEPSQPEVVAVERPRERQDDLTDLYEKYRTGELAYDEETEIDAVHPGRDSPVSECRSEVVQIGFRLADRLDHERVHAVDYPMRLTADFDDDELEREGIDIPTMQERAQSKLDIGLPDPQTVQRTMAQHLHESSIIDHLRFLNRDAQLRVNHEMMFSSLVAGSERRYVGSRMLAAWYERNLRIVENLWRAATDETDRILLLIGNGHVRSLWHLLSETPMFRPRSALDVLETED
ncbi:DUF5694 domain-containing protein [Halovivax gelatinilyticus]|uniref:DUF5694 domain-containing protein n=1 Tax=Halovivax gelatinilyticus TaxID=2961597 RepID=UPI0020CA27FD|nr:DUF5694 domain-containing protein [Halovivax gelatinilyticus]